MEIDTIYQNVEHKDVIDTRGPQIQSHSQDEGQAQKKSKQKKKSFFIQIEFYIYSKI